MKPRPWKLLLLLLAVPGLLLAGLQSWVAARFTPGEIARRLEETWNCRASAGSASVRLTGFPARVQILDLKITPREPAVSPASPGETFVHIREILLEVNLLSLLFGGVDVQRALINGVTMQTVKWADGGNSLRLLLAAPGTAARPPQVPLTLEDEDEIPAPAGDGPGGTVRPFHLSELPVTSTLHEARISNASWSMLNHRRHTAIHFTDATAVLTGMTLDPENPAAGGAAAVNLNTRLILDRPEDSTRTLDFLISAGGQYQLFDPVTGDLSHDLAFEVAVKKGSLINRIPTLTELNDTLGKLKGATGLDLALPSQAALVSDTLLPARLQNGVIRFTGDVFFPFDTYQAGLAKGSWLSLRDESHQFTGRLLAGGDLSKKAAGGITGFLKARSAAVADLVGRTVMGQIMNPAGQIELPFESSGPIGRPEVKLASSFTGALKRSAAEAGKDLLKDALEGGNQIENLIDSVREGLRKDRPGTPEAPGK